MRDGHGQAHHPTAAFAVSSNGPRAGQTLHITDFSTDPTDVGIAWRAWDFGDGATATGASPTHRYVAPGEYTIKLTTGTFDGRVAAAEQRISVRAGRRS